MYLNLIFTYYVISENHVLSDAIFQKKNTLEVDLFLGLPWDFNWYNVIPNEKWFLKKSNWINQL